MAGASSGMETDEGFEQVQKARWERPSEVATMGGRGGVALRAYRGGIERRSLLDTCVFCDFYP